MWKTFAKMNAQKLTWREYGIALLSLCVGVLFAIRLLHDYTNPAPTPPPQEKGQR